MEQTKYTKFDKVQIPAVFIPSFRTTIAIQNGVEKNLLFRTWGGLGDQICAEPTLRYALKTFKGCDISLETEHPELFQHLNFKDVFHTKKVRPNHDNYLVFETITQPNDTNLVWQFFSHMITNCVDFPSLCALRLTLPVADKEVMLADVGYKPDFDLSRAVVLHPGKHWQSKTFPKEFWDSVISTIISEGGLPVIVGANTDDNRGTVDVMTDGCVDMRNKLSIMETVSILKQSKVLLTNDSSPLHMAVDSDAWIGFVATCKHTDHIGHWRRGQWLWRMQNFGKGGIWDILDYCPNVDNEVTAEFVGDDNLRSWLPDPVEFAKWGVSKL
jgi:hypothetical protein